MKLSIIIPCFNTVETIKKNLISIINQIGHFDVEIIVVDDGSTDGTFEWLQETIKHYSFIKCFKQENQGSGAARNLGISKASGDYYWFVDADDELVDNAIDTIFSVLKDNPRKELFIFGYSIVENGKRRSKTFEPRNFEGEYVRNKYQLFFDSRLPLAIQGAPWNKIFKADVIKTNNISYPNFKRHQDEGFISSYVSYTKNVMFIDKTIYIHFANNYRNTLKKFSHNYYENVKQLFEFAINVYSSWNLENFVLLNGVRAQYLYNTIKCCDMAYLNKDKESINKMLIESNTNAKIDYKEAYKLFPKRKIDEIKTIYTLLSKAKYNRIYAHFKWRVFVQRYLRGLFLKIRKS